LSFFSLKIQSQRWEEFETSEFHLWLRRLESKKRGEAGGFCFGWFGG
jgi:hypothetical protein